MLVVFLNWLLIGGTLIGLGCLLENFFSYFNQSNRIVVSLLSGLVVATLFCELWRILAPLNWVPLLILGGLATIGISFRLKKQPFASSMPLKNYFMYGGAILVLCVVVGAETVRQPSFVDAGNYHFQCVKNGVQFGSLRGIGNVLPHYAFHSSAFSLSSLFVWTVDDGNGVEHVFTCYNSFLTIVLACTIFELLMRWSLRLQVFLVLTLILYVDSFLFWMSTPSADVSGAALLLIFGLLVLDQPKSFHSDFTLFLFPIVVCATKPSLLPILIFYPIILLFKASREQALGLMLRTVIWGGLIFITYLANHVIMSGYVLFPYVKIPFTTLEWQIPQPKVDLGTNLIKVWARTKNLELALQFPEMSFLDWFPYWWKSQPLKNLLIYAFPFVVAPFFYRKVLRVASSQVWLFALFISFLITWGIWFAMAPDWRFAVGYLPFLCLFVPLYLLDFSWLTYRWRHMPIASVCFLLFYIGFNAHLRVLPTCLVLNEPHAEVELVKAETNDPRIDLYSPKEGTCTWYSDELCTSFVDPNIALIGDNLKQGIKPSYKKKVVKE